MRKALQDQQDVNLHLRGYIDSVLLNIMEKYPELLEVRNKWASWSGPSCVPPESPSCLSPSSSSCVSSPSNTIKEGEKTSLPICSLYKDDERCSSPWLVMFEYQWLGLPCQTLMGPLNWSVSLLIWVTMTQEPARTTSGPESNNVLWYEQYY